MCTVRTHDSLKVKNTFHKSVYYVRRVDHLDSCCYCGKALNIFVLSCGILYHKLSTCVKLKMNTYFVFTRSNKNINIAFKHVFLWQMGEWMTVRITAPLATTKLNEQMTVELKGRKSENSEVFIQRIAGCNVEGMHFFVNG